MYLYGAQNETHGKHETGLESKGEEGWLPVDLDDDPINQGGIQISNSRHFC